jgi:hypothetical protein
MTSADQISKIPLVGGFSNSSQASHMGVLSGCANFVKKIGPYNLSPCLRRFLSDVVCGLHERAVAKTCPFHAIDD